MVEWWHKVIGGTVMAEHTENTYLANITERLAEVEGILPELDDKGKEKPHRIKLPVTEQELITINVMILAMVWRFGRKRPLSEMGDYIGIGNKRIITNLCSGMRNDMTPSHINKRIAGDISRQLDIPKEIFLGEGGVLISAAREREVEIKWILYRRLLNMVKHGGESRLKSLHDKDLSGFDKVWLAQYGGHESIEAELNKKIKARKEEDLPLSTKALKQLERRLEDDVKESCMYPEKVKNQYYRRLIEWAKGAYIPVLPVDDIKKVTDQLSGWSFDMLRGVKNERVLKEYQRILQEQMAYMNVVMRLIKK